ncbi:MAG TPA: hypothetical protein VGY57_14550 [Vicinamibacterales bacterium]|jgi:hypothetical protein|nr:hypothetical protein [Vicinamibacterales bacterium]
MTDEERERGRADFIEKYAPWYTKMEYRPMLQMKYTVFHARWLVNENKNAASWRAS